MADTLTRPTRCRMLAEATIRQRRDELRADAERQRERAVTVEQYGHQAAANSARQLAARHELLAGLLDWVLGES